MLILPQLRASFKNIKPRQKALLVAGGREPSLVWFLAAAAQYPVWAIDRGINTCYNCGVVPERIIGDTDSADVISWNWGKTVCSTVDKYPVEKDYTDLQLALRTLGGEQEKAAAIVTGCWGGRFDHTWGNVKSLLWGREWGIEASILADEKEVLIVVEGAEEVEFELVQQVKNISLLPLSACCTEVSLYNVRWPINNQTLYANRPYTLSNRLLSSKQRDFKMSVGGGFIGVYFEWY